MSPEQIVVAPGSKPLLFALFDILEGDVLLPRPSWVSYEPQVLHAGKKLFWVETDEYDRHAISGVLQTTILRSLLTTWSEQALRDAYDQALQNNAMPRIFLMNSPSNPTGRVYSEDNVTVIQRFCEEHNMTLISDEIYSDIFFDGKMPPSPAADGQLDSSRIIVTGGLSKVSMW